MSGRCPVSALVPARCDGKNCFTENRKASAPPKLPPAAIPPPKCIPQSQYNQPYEWEYQLTRTLGKGGHGVRTHVFAIYYAPADIFSLSTRVTCSVRF